MSNNTILFLGATGGVVNACLTSLLLSNHNNSDNNSPTYKAIAMVRNPSKLKTQLQTLQTLSEDQINTQLTIVQGDATNLSDVKSTLLTNVTSNIETSLPSMIITGVGGAPVLQFNIWRPWDFMSIDQPNLCGDSAKTLISALKEIYSERPSLRSSKPAVTFVSTTGITNGPEDVPFAMRWLYHQVLAVPHIDKRVMESTFREQLERGDERDSMISQVTGIRPTLLMGTGALKEAIGIEKIRAGTEEKPELGYTVQRADVGKWIFENVVRDVEGEKWRGKMVTLTA